MKNNDNVTKIPKLSHYKKIIEEQLFGLQRNLKLEHFGLSSTPNNIAFLEQVNKQHARHLRLTYTKKGQTQLLEQLAQFTYAIPIIPKSLFTVLEQLEPLESSNDKAFDFKELEKLIEEGVFDSLPKLNELIIGLDNLNLSKEDKEKLTIYTNKLETIETLILRYRTLKENQIKLKKMIQDLQWLNDSNTLLKFQKAILNNKDKKVKEQLDKMKDLVSKIDNSNNDKANRDEQESSTLIPLNSILNGLF